MKPPIMLRFSDVATRGKPYRATPDELQVIDEALAEPRPQRRSRQSQPRRRLIWRPTLKLRPASKGRVHKGRTGR